MQNWFDVPKPDIHWLVDGLIPSDSSASIVGKPKAGKSTFIRNLIASVIKGRPFLGRSVDIPADTGRVLYVHLDRKDSDWRVFDELRQLGITREDSDRMIFRSSADLPPADAQGQGFTARLEWLQKEVKEAKPHLVVIDLLWQFVIAKNSNDYNAVLSGINSLQDGLLACGYRGALVVAIHGRKATSAVDQFDDILGSTGQRGSFSTNIMLTHRRNENVYTVSSDQTERDDTFGEIPETILVRNPDKTLQLGPPMAELAKQEKHAKFEEDLQRLVLFVEANPGVEMDTVTAELAMSKKYALKVLAGASAFVRREGSGIKGDPYKYHPKSESEDGQ